MRAQQIVERIEDRSGTDWGAVLEVIPYRSNPRPSASGKSVFSGGLALRCKQSGVRFQVSVYYNPRKNELFLWRAAADVAGNKTFPYVSFDGFAEDQSFKAWCLKVWEKAYIDGDGCMPYRTQQTSKQAFYGTNADFSLRPNGYGELPWNGKFTGLRGQLRAKEMARGGTDGGSATHQGDGGAAGSGEGGEFDPTTPAGGFE